MGLTEASRMCDATKLFEALLILAFLILLGIAIYIIITQYNCDGLQCRAAETASENAQLDTKEYVRTLLYELYNDNIWAIPYIGATIMAPLCLWFLCLPITIKSFAIIFFISFVIIYFAIAFLGHHYIRPISNYTISYIEKGCDDIPGVTIAAHPICETERTIVNSFTAPVDIF